MNQQEKRTRLVLTIIAAVMVTLFVCGQCAFDIGTAYQVGKINNCLYPPHVCQHP